MVLGGRFVRLLQDLAGRSLATEEYHLNMVLTDKYGIVIYEESKVFMDYSMLDLHHTIENLKELSGKIKS